MTPVSNSTGPLRDPPEASRAQAKGPARGAQDAIARLAALKDKNAAGAPAEEARPQAGQAAPRGLAAKPARPAKEKPAAPAVDTVDLASRRDPTGLAQALRQQVDQLLAAMGQPSGAINQTPALAPMVPVSGSPSTMFMAQASFSLNLSVVQQVSTANGVSQSAFQFSLQMDLSWMAAGWGQDAAAAAGPLDQFLGLFGLGGAAGAAKPQAPSAQSLWDGFMDYFSPKNTADRILNFATSFYPSSRFAKAEGGDTEANRQSFSDFIGGAIQKGFDQAMGILGKVDAATQAVVDETHERVFAGLADFVKGGLSQAGLGTAAQAQAWQMSLEMNYSYSQTTVTAYNAAGQGAGAGAARRVEHNA